MSETYKCRHGGPGELVTAEKRIFVETIGSNLDRVHKALLFKAPRQEIVAAELVMLEETFSSKEALKSMADDALMKLYFCIAVDNLLKARIEEARINARMGVCIAMYLKHGDGFWAMTQQSPEVQKKNLLDFHTAIGQIESEGGLARVLNAQTPCDCLEQALPSLK
mmetsp:Transcript_6084/g.13264  ORF Transcript_6084/g.13264 Transcript_6084/m.13264 type:complete len:166 (+) Transcript_6084:249-746(+)|eukprot:CAMPEP_0178499666 /NCGR_PEP_ID=MMETSP0696-20121128/15947_1 /TAXON_ID=265572 /ORGANISM="Extubocellulus spinifer, Strain CCMP396" /LENGTH=165 /DNA_ID=CAMNT_0020128381 /DNA_START=187 /DNA_END=684 /DNA_ORIENTATION=-